MKGLASHSVIPDMASRKSVVSNHISKYFSFWRLTTDVLIAHTHFHNGTPFSANMVEHKCEAKK